MQVTIIGAHQAETKNMRFTTILVDGGLAIDAGSLASGLTLDEQFNVTDVLITHRHWDHVKDLAGFGFNLNSKLTSGAGPISAAIYCTDEVKQSLETRLLVPGFWVNFFEAPDPVHPIFLHQAIVPGGEYTIGQFRVRSIPINHSVPTTGYQLTDPAGGKLYYTSDNGPGCGAAWATAEPDVLITECTFSNDRCGVDGGKMFGHLCPSQLQTELETFRARRGYLPRVYLLHLNPFDEGKIVPEVAQVAQNLGAVITVATEGTTFTV